VSGRLELDSKSGSRLEHAVDDTGRALVLKHEHPSRDWLLRATGDTGRALALHEAGVFKALPPQLDSTIETVERTDDGGWTVVMRDESASLLPAEGAITRATVRRLFAGMAALHATFADAPPEVSGLCTTAQRLDCLSPRTLTPLVDLHFVPALIVSSWARVPDVFPADVAEAVLRLVDDPAPLAAAFDARPCTLTHGDAKLSNFGLDGDRVIWFDWGCFTGVGPPAFDFARFVAHNATRVDADRDDLLADVRIALGEHHDEVALRLALLAVLVSFGWEKALNVTADDPDARAREEADFDWWIAQARASLEVWSPT
jgi:hypothetical protein